MNKKNYLKPDAEYVSFYSKENMMANLSIEDYATEDDGIVGGVSGVGGSSGEGPEYGDWE